MAKVLIIGAGLGGLVLGQILQHNGVPFEIFERDAADSTRSQGWAVALVECLPRLEKLMPPAIEESLYTNSVNANSGDHDEIGFVDARSGEKVGSMGGVPRGEKEHILRVARQGFRQYLMQTCNLPVTFGKQFTHYKKNEGSVTAFFGDGTSATGSLLVGADGAHSHVLDQLIGGSEHRPQLSEYVPIFGEVELPREMYEPVRARGNAVILAGAGRQLEQIGMLNMAKDGSRANFFWALMLREEDPKALSDWVQKASDQEVYDLCLERTEEFHPSMTDLIRHGGPKAITHPRPKFLEYVPPEDLPEGRVVVIGDAAHTMIPLKGAGANTAILDACDLGELLTKSAKSGGDFVEVVPAFNKIMIPRGQENVLASRAIGHGGDNPANYWSVKFRRPEPVVE